MSVSEWDREHINGIMAGHGDWFTAQLLRLCAKADAENLVLIGIGFPDVVDLYKEWRDHDPGGRDSFRCEYVHVHDGSCNDYTGCNDRCGSWPKAKAVYRMGAWRRA